MNKDLKEQYAADMAVNPRAWEWWQYLSLVDGMWHNSTAPIPEDDFIGYLGGSGVRRDPTAPDRDELAKSQMVSSPPLCSKCDKLHHPLNDCEGKITPEPKPDMWIEHVYKKIDDYFDNVTPEKLAEDIKRAGGAVEDKCALCAEHMDNHYLLAVGTPAEIGPICVTCYNTLFDEFRNNIQPDKCAGCRLREAYRLARNAAAGLTNYCEETASSMRCEKELEQAETIFREWEHNQEPVEPGEGE